MRTLKENTKMVTSNLTSKMGISQKMVKNYAINILCFI